MGNKKHHKKFKSFIGDRKSLLFLLLVLCSALVAGVFVWQEGQEIALSPLSSNAGGEPQAHWPHSTVPFQLTLINSAGPAVWNTHIKNALSDWQQAGPISYRKITGERIGSCELYPEAINVCSFKDANTWFLAYGQYVSWSATGHIIAANMAFNDAAYNGSTEFNSPAWRNYIVCGYLGWTSGINFKPNPAGKSTSCMEWSAGSNTVANQQHPDRDDLGNMKVLYNHRDDNSSSGFSSKTAQANNRTTPAQWGQKVGVSGDGLVETYKLDLGDGYQLVTKAYKK